MSRKGYFSFTYYLGFDVIATTEHDIEYHPEHKRLYSQEKGWYDIDVPGYTLTKIARNELDEVVTAKIPSHQLKDGTELSVIVHELVVRSGKIVSSYVTRLEIKLHQPEEKKEDKFVELMDKLGENTSPDFAGMLAYAMRRQQRELNVFKLNKETEELVDWFSKVLADMSVWLEPAFTALRVKQTGLVAKDEPQPPLN